MLMFYPLLALKVWRSERRRGRGRRHGDAGLYAASCVIGKFPQCVGLARYWLRRLLRRTPTLIEYKQPSRSQPA